MKNIIKKIKSLFWKTYRVEYSNLDRSLLRYVFFRGFTWDVVEMAGKEAEKQTQRDKEDFLVCKIERIY